MPQTVRQAAELLDRQLRVEGYELTHLAANVSASTMESSTPILKDGNANGTYSSQVSIYWLIPCHSGLEYGLAHRWLAELCFRLTPLAVEGLGGDDTATPVEQVRGRFATDLGDWMTISDPKVEYLRKEGDHTVQIPFEGWKVEGDLTEMRHFGILQAHLIGLVDQGSGMEDAIPREWSGRALQRALMEIKAGGRGGMGTLGSEQQQEQVIALEMERVYARTRSNAKKKVLPNGEGNAKGHPGKEFWNPVIRISLQTVLEDEEEGQEAQVGAVVLLRNVESSGKSKSNCERKQCVSVSYAGEWPVWHTYTGDSRSAEEADFLKGLRKHIRKRGGEVASLGMNDDSVRR